MTRALARQHGARSRDDHERAQARAEENQT
jgi:hypothetical protein